MEAIYPKRSAISLLLCIDEAGSVRADLAKTHLRKPFYQTFSRLRLLTVDKKMNYSCKIYPKYLRNVTCSIQKLNIFKRNF